MQICNLLLRQCLFGSDCESKPADLQKQHNTKIAYLSFDSLRHHPLV